MEITLTITPYDISKMWHTGSPRTPITADRYGSLEPELSDEALAKRCPVTPTSGVLFVDSYLEAKIVRDYFRHLKVDAYILWDTTDDPDPSHCVWVANYDFKSL